MIKINEQASEREVSQRFLIKSKKVFGGKKLLLIGIKDKVGVKEFHRLEKRERERRNGDGEVKIEEF